MRYIENLPAQARHLHTSRYTMRWADMDAFGHVNNSTYFTYFEQVRIDWLAALGEARELVLANVSCTFFKPLIYSGEVEVALFGGRAGRSSLDSYYELRLANCAEQLCTLGHGTIVWFDHAAGRYPFRTRYGGTWRGATRPAAERRCVHQARLYSGRREEFRCAPALTDRAIMPPWN